MEYANCEMVERGMAGFGKYNGRKMFGCDIYDCPYNNGEKLMIGLNPINICSSRGIIKKDEKGRIDLGEKVVSS